MKRCDAVGGHQSPCKYRPDGRRALLQSGSDRAVLERDERYNFWVRQFSGLRSPSVSLRCVAGRAYADGFMYHYWESEGLFLSNAPDRPACTTVVDRGVAMIPLSRWARTEDWRIHKKK